MPYWRKLDMTDPLVIEGIRHIPEEYENMTKSPDPQISPLLWQVLRLDRGEDRLEEEIADAMVEKISPKFKEDYAWAMQKLIPSGKYASIKQAVGNLIFDKYCETVDRDYGSIHDFPLFYEPDIEDVSTVDWADEFANHPYADDAELLSEAVCLKLKPSIIPSLLPMYMGFMQRIRSCRAEKNDMTQLAWRAIKDNISEAHDAAFVTSVTTLINPSVTFKLADFIMTKQLEFATQFAGGHVMESLDQFQA